MQLRLGLALSLTAVSLVGCSAIGIKDGSLDYQKSTALPPLQYPEGINARPATPLYPAPVVEQLAIDNAPKLVNKRGNRFEIPRPEKVAAAPVQAQEETTTIGRPQLLTDGNGNPLIKIDGNSATIWQYTNATLSILNYNVVGQAKNAYEVTFKHDGNTLVLKLASSGSSHTLAVFTPNNTFADKQIAADVLTQIYQNWPA